MKMTKKDENEALNYAKTTIQKEFKKQYGFAPSLKEITPLECSYTYNHDFDMWTCDSLGFRINNIGYGWGIRYGLARNEAYDM